MTEVIQEQLPSPPELHAKLEDLVRRDLLGPIGRPEEEVDERSVQGSLTPSGLSGRLITACAIHTQS